MLGQTASRATPTPISDRVNRVAPSWLRFSGEERTRFESLTNAGFKSTQDSYLLNRLRLTAELQPIRWVRFRLQAQDSRVFGQNTRPAPASQKDAIDLRTAYAQVGEDEDLFVFRAGRQSLTFGEGRLVADPNWSNVGRSFDAARLTMRRRKAKAEIFTGAVVKVTPNVFNRPAPGEHFHGVYGSLGGWAPGAVLEPYGFWHLAHGYKSERGGSGHLNAKTFGFRLAGKVPAGLDYAAEMAAQRGSSAGDSVGAWAGHWVVGGTFGSSPHLVRLYGEFNRASGDNDPRDGRRGGFDPLYPSTHDKLGVADLFTWTNLAHYRSGFEYTLRRGLTVAAAYNSFKVLSTRDGLYGGGKLVARSADGTADNNVGQEADLQMLWSLASGTQVNIGYGRLFPGLFLRQTTKGLPLNCLFTNITHQF